MSFDVVNLGVVIPVMHNLLLSPQRATSPNSLICGPHIIHFIRY